MSSDNLENIPRASCLFCDGPFNEGEFRVFCNNECHELYIRQEKARFLKKIEDILRRNWNILNEVLATKAETEVSKWELMLKDYNFCYHTHYRTTEKGETIYYCYDYSLTVNGDSCYVWLE